MTKHQMSAKGVVTVSLRKENRPHSMCYSHFDNEIRNGAISITQWGFINDYYMVYAVGQWGKIMITVMMFSHTVGHVRVINAFSRLCIPRL